MNDNIPPIDERLIPDKYLGRCCAIIEIGDANTVMINGAKLDFDDAAEILQRMGDNV